MHRYNNRGFTLIELSIVLVIIGLIVGGILTGQDLIKAAEIRAQISQIEKYNTAVNTFRGKYGGLPGDLVLNLATQFNFSTTGCDASSGERNGDGLLEGFNKPSGWGQIESEHFLFWQDLGKAGLIDQNFPTGGATTSGCNTLNTTLNLTQGTSYVGNYLPTAKIGRSNFIYTITGVPNTSATGYNWFGLAPVSSIVASGGDDGDMTSGAGLSVLQAYSIDKKIDDGTPFSGSVIAGNNTAWWFGYINDAGSDSSTTCSNDSTNAYSTKISGGSNVNCALVFRFQ